MKEKCVLVLIAVVLIALTGSCVMNLAKLHVSAASGDIIAYPLHIIAGLGAAFPSGLSPAQIRAVYNLPSTGGSGTIAIVDPYDDPTILDDTNVFSTQYNLTVLNDTNFEKHMMTSAINFDAGWSEEISLDVQWAHAIAPEAKILLVEATDSTLVFANGTAGPLLNAVDYARNRSDVIAVSMSWTASGFSSESNYDSFFTSSFGASFFASSGDNSENASWPAASPNVIGVGGTTLNFYSNGSFASETVWNDASGATGGGVSAYETVPSYQVSYGVQGVNGHRGVPDVSYDADPNPGFPVYMNFSGQQLWLPVGGTSAGTPQWAAIYSLRPTASNPTLYKIAKSMYNSSSFRDITVGGNGNYNATAGYDFCTGLGSPLTGAFVGGTGDVNLDGTVNILDAILTANAFNTNRTSSNWNALADINNDGAVDILDEIILANNFGNSYANGTKSGASGQSSPVGTMTQDGPSILVDPSQTIVFKGEFFSVNVSATDVTDLQGWECKLYWNSTVLNCTNAVVVTPTVWQDNTQDDGSGLQPNYNSTHARFWKAQAGNYPAPSFNGSTTIATLTFQAMQPGTTSLTLTDTILGDSAAQPIAFTVSSGSATVYSGRYMRSDTQTVNGLNAYKLNIPQSNTSAYSTQYGEGIGASWGIRAWVRHANGSEQEISLDGQTGTPKAVVSRSSGSGIQSATVTVAQTALQSTDSLVVRVYMQVGDSGWTLCATFTTEQLQATTLQQATWTVYYYTYASWSKPTDTTIAKIYWGTTTYNTRIQNLQYT